MYVAIAYTFHLLWIASLAAPDTSVHPDDFVSVSCPTYRSCYLLDAAGNLLFSTDRGKTFSLRSHQAQLGLRKIRFSGLVNGWGLDNRGGLWHTRDSGLSFESMLVPENKPVVDIAQDASRKEGIWLAHPNGMLRFLDQQATIQIKQHAMNPIRSLSVCNQTMLVVQADGKLSVSYDGGVKWKKFDRIGSEVERLADPMCDGRVVSFDRIGQVILVDTKTGSFEILFKASVTKWMDAASLDRGWILAGGRGHVASLQAALNNRIKLEIINQSLPDMVSLVVHQGGLCLVGFRDGSVWRCHQYTNRWTPLGHPLPPSVKRIAFSNANFGVALVDKNSIYKTKSSGATWEKIGSWPEMVLWDVFFVNDKVGWAVGDHGSVVHTIDGGSSWTIASFASGVSLRAIRFTDEKSGWILGDKQSIYQTRDAGRSWTINSLGEEKLFDLAFVDTDTGFVVGEKGVILVTRDGGGSWQNIASPVSMDLKTIAFLDEQHGVIGGDRGSLLQTFDGGDSWKRLDLHTNADIHFVLCPTIQDRCLLGGQNGLFMVGKPFDQFP